MATHFSVIRTSQGLLQPSDHTPSGVLDLSPIDRLGVLRCNARTLHVFRQPQNAQVNTVAADVIRKALSEALVPYYPLAGRLKTGDERVVQIDCSGEGVWFVKASADCGLDTIESQLFDQFYQDALLPVLDDANVVVGRSQSQSQREPLLQMQVTQFSCGGFVIGLIFCHTICDGLGAAQFLNAVGEKATGLQKVSVDPIWSRDFISECPNTTSFHSKKNHGALPLPPPPLPEYELKHASVDISVDQISELKRELLEEYSITASSFEIVAASCWMARARTIMMTSSSKVDDNDYKLVFFANCRQLVDPPLTEGFYGNCFFPVTITSSAKFVSRASHARVVELIQEAKADLPREFRKFITRFNGCDDDEDDVDPFAPPLSYNTLFISEWGRLGFNRVDYGWGPPSHVVPIQGSGIIPVGIVGSLPLPRKGVHLLTWCVHEGHLRPFIGEMMNLTNKC